MSTKNAVINIRLGIEKIVLVLFFAAIVLAGPAAILKNEISHEFPHGYFASDAFQHQIRAEAIKDYGNFRYEAPYISKGLEEIVGRYPPALYHVAIVFSHASGLEIYDSIYFIVLLFPAIAILALYFVIRDLSQITGYLSLAMSVLIYAFPLSAGFLFGHWPSVFAQVFLIGLFWSVFRIELEKSFLLVGIFLSSIIMSHTSEAIFGILFIGFFSFFRIIKRKFSGKDLKTIVLSILLASAVSAYYIVIFTQTFGATQPYSFSVEPKWEGNPGFYISDFGFLLVPIIVGMAFALFKAREMHVAFIAGFAMLAGGFMNYMGFTFRSFQIRFFWPIYLSVFFGFGIYMLIRLVAKKWSSAAALSVALIFSLLTFGIISFPNIPHLQIDGNQGIMNHYHWNMLKWISTNTEKDSKIYFFYGDIYSQDALLRNSKRIHAQAEPDDFIAALQNKSILRNYVSDIPGDSGGMLARWDGFMSLSEAKESIDAGFFGKKDICRFDYLVFDKISRQPVLAQYNMLIASKMAEKGASLAYENEAVIVLKNNNIGGDCIEEGSF